ncbi:MAG: class I SAM-dependent methyltransferase [Candidatus Vecturithrix sp.]|jgi:ubiquinone/menaquinone biosynthesis C-methylase UbiE|nr:class I SAM-dependent methyltransferase [Candidatus Vecturithrix sp.]
METQNLTLSSDLQEVQEYWNEYINDIEVARHEIGSREFFDELEHYRYQKLAYLPQVVSFPGYKGKKVLEIGCGVGLDSLQFARAGAELTAIDLTPNAITLAKRNLEVHGFQATFLNMNAEALEFPDNHFDAVYSHGVLHHTPRPQQAIDEVLRVLKPGGEAVIMLYKKNSWMHLLTRIEGVHVEHEEKEAPVIFYYTCDEVHQLFAKFERVRLLIERYPHTTPKYSRMKALLYNHIMVPVFHILPKALIRPLGAHIMIWAYKPGK